MRVLLLILLLVSGAVKAQLGMIESALMQAEKGAVASAGKPQVYTGTPIVSIFPDKPPEKLSGWMDEEKKRLFGTTDILKTKKSENTFSEDLKFDLQNQFDADSFKQQVKSVIGNKTRNVAWVTYTPDFNFVVQILSSGDALVEEYVQVMLTEPDRFPVFSRVLPSNAEILRALSDGREMTLTPTQQKTTTLWQGAEKLTTGVHNFYLSYRVPHVVQEDKNRAGFNLSLTGMDWGFACERFNALFLMPAPTEGAQVRVFFGRNDVEIPEAVDVKTDKSGNILLTLKQPLPAFADVKLQADFDKEILRQVQMNDMDSLLVSFSDKETVWVLAGCFSLLLIAYLFLSVKVYKNQLTLMPSALFLSCFAGTKWTADFLHNLYEHAKITHKRGYFLRFAVCFANHPRYVSMLRGVYFLCKTGISLVKYAVMLICMTIVFGAFLKGFELHMTGAQKWFLLIFEMGILYGFYKFLIHPNLMQSYVRCRRIVLLETPLTGLSENAITALFIQQFPYAVVFRVLPAFLERYTQTTGKQLPVKTY